LLEGAGGREEDEFKPSTAVFEQGDEEFWK